MHCSTNQQIIDTSFGWRSKRSPESGSISLVMTAPPIIDED
jgi:hypothetical protein